MDIDKLVDTVTKVIMERLNSESLPKVVQFGDVPEGLISGACEMKKGETAADIEGCDYIVLTMDCFKQLHSGSPCEPAAGTQETSGCKSCCEDDRIIDLRGKRLLHERDLREHDTKRGDVIQVDKNVIITALAFDYAKSVGAKICKEN